MTIEETKKFIQDISNGMGSMTIEYWSEKTGDKLREALNVLEQELEKMNFEEVKEMFKESINATGTMNQAIENLIQSIYLKGYKDAMSEWIPVSERLPDKRGEYLVTQKTSFSDYVYRSIAGYALNLHDVDEYDFADKKRAGWYEYDSEFGYHEIDGVIAWMPLPEPYKADKEDKK